MITIDQLKKYLWAAAVDLRGHIDAASYKEYIFPLVFFKRISDVYHEEYQSHRAEALAMGSSEADADEYALGQMENSSIQIPAGAHWDDVFNTTDNLGQRLKEAFQAIELANPPKEVDGRLVGGLQGVFGDKSLWTNRTKVPDATLRSLLNNFNRLTLSMAECPADEMGAGYEYLIGQFADDAGHTAQEFYTNRTVVELMAEILQLQPGESLYDPTCGSGGMLIKSLAHLRAQGREWRDVKVYGQELNPDTAAIARMNCYLHGVNEFQIVTDDTLERPAFISNGRVQQFDVVLANPPYSIKTWNREMFQHDRYGRNFLGVPPQSKADYAFIQHILASMNERNGRCAILLPHGVLFRDEEFEMRKNLVDTDKLECVIGLGPNLFFNASMEACIMICNNKKSSEREGKVLFIDAKEEVTRKNAESYLEDQHIAKIVATYNAFVDKEGFAKIVANNDIQTNNSLLSIQSYVEALHEDVVYNTRQAVADWETGAAALHNEITNLLNCF